MSVKEFELPMAFVTFGACVLLSRVAVDRIEVHGPRAHLLLAWGLVFAAALLVADFLFRAIAVPWAGFLVASALVIVWIAALLVGRRSVSRIGPPPLPKGGPAMTASRYLDMLRELAAHGMRFYKELLRIHGPARRRRRRVPCGRFEGLALRWAELVDAIAEHINARGGAAPSSLELTVELSRLHARSKREPPGLRLVEVPLELERLLRSIGRCAATAAEVGDTTGAELLRGIHDEQSRTLWTLRAWMEVASTGRERIAVPSGAGSEVGCRPIRRIPSDFDRDEVSPGAHETDPRLRTDPA